MPNHKVPISKDKLTNLYLNKHLSTRKLAEIFDCDRMTILNRLKEYQIPKRSSSEAKMRYKKFNFSGNRIEKAYILGFRLGDLNVYQTSSKSELVVARCNTTQTVQVRLIKRLFSKYGKVTISIGKYSTNVNCFLNKSFKFLLPKHREIPKWIMRNKATCNAFIAGYTDAEGSFLLNQAKARFKIDSYDAGILQGITEWLTQREIRAKLRRINKLGDLRTDGKKFNADLWRLNVNEAISLLKFIQQIKPFIQHRTRLKHLQLCEDNILFRLSNKTIKYETN